MWNRATVIAEALSSIKGPDNGLWEIILVDDGSSDDTVAVATEVIAKLGLTERTQIIEQANAGPGVARNTAVAHAKGEYVACLDSDDMWFDWTLSTLLDLVSERPEIDVVFFRSTQITDRKSDQYAQVTQTPLVLRDHEGYLDAFLKDSSVIYFGSGIFMCRKSVFEASGQFSDKLRVAEDLDLFLRLEPQANVTLVIEPRMMAHVCETEDSLTTSFDAALQGLEFIRASEREGLYPKGDAELHRKRRILIARTTQFTIMNGWINHSRKASYGLFLRTAWYLANNRCRLFILRYHAMIFKDLKLAALRRLGLG